MLRVYQWYKRYKGQLIDLYNNYTIKTGPELTAAWLSY